LPLIYSAIGSATVFILYYANAITPKLFYSYIFTQTAYFLGVFFFNFYKPWENYGITEASIGKFTYARKIENDTILYGKVMLHFFAAVMFISHLVVYAAKGIPVLQTSRLEIFYNGEGFGIYSRFINVSITAVSYLYFYFFFCLREDGFKAYYHFYLLMAFVFLLLSGSKTALLQIPYVFFCFLLLHKNNPSVKNNYLVKNFKKIVFRISILALVGVLIVISVQSNNEDKIYGSAFALFLRFIHSGDTFWYSYPDNIVYRISGEYGLLALFNDFLGFFRIYKWDEMPQNLGLTIIRFHHWGDGVFGPNARHNIFGIIYFGYYGSIIFSFLLGLVVSFVLFIMPILFQNKFLSGIFFTLVFNSLVSFELDPMLVLTNFDNAIIILPILLIIATVIYIIITKTQFKIYFNKIFYNR
jgi:hypothetical protein